MLSCRVQARLPVLQRKHLGISKSRPLRKQAPLQHLHELHHILPLIHQLPLQLDILPNKAPRHDRILIQPHQTDLPPFAHRMHHAPHMTRRLPLRRSKINRLINRPTPLQRLRIDGLLPHYPHRLHPRPLPNPPLQPLQLPLIPPKRNHPRPHRQRHHDRRPTIPPRRRAHHNRLPSLDSNVPQPPERHHQVPHVHQIVHRVPQFSAQPRFVQWNAVLQRHARVLGKGAVAPHLARQLFRARGAAVVDPEEEYGGGIVSRADRAVEEDKLASGERHGVGAERDDAPDGGEPGDEGRGERVGARAVINFALVGDDSCREDGDDSAAWVGGGRGDGSEAQGLGGRFEDEGAVV